MDFQDIPVSAVTVNGDRCRLVLSRSTPSRQFAPGSGARSR